MASMVKDLGIDHLSFDEKLALLHELWDSIAVEPVSGHLSDGLRGELERRLAEHQANLGDVVPWEQIKAEAFARFPR